MSPNNACVLVSGGVDSFVLLSNSLARYHAITPLYIQNHLRWENVELFWLKKLLRELKVANLQPLKILSTTMKDIYENHWSITGTKVPGARSPDDAVYLPGRNVVFLAKAAVFAALNGIDSIEIGILKGNPFTDASKPFLSRYSNVLSQGLNRELRIRAPFLKYKKEDVLLMGRRLPLDLTFSCMNPKGYGHCGECNKCMERKRSFFAAGLFDRTKYKKPGL